MYEGRLMKQFVAWHEQRKKKKHKIQMLNSMCDNRTGAATIKKYVVDRSIEYVSISNKLSFSWIYGCTSFLFFLYLQFRNLFFYMESIKRGNSSMLIYKNILSWDFCLSPTFWLLGKWSDSHHRNHLFMKIFFWGFSL